MYNYQVKQVVRVVDGDTFDLLIDVGFYVTYGHRFRILNVDTPERNQKGWADCTRFAEEWLVERKLRVNTAKADSFGRWLAEVYDADTGEKYAEAVSEFMADSGFSS